MRRIIGIVFIALPVVAVFAFMFAVSWRYALIATGSGIVALVSIVFGVWLLTREEQR